MNGQTLKHLRMIYGLEKREFASIVGISYQNLCSMEAGRIDVSEAFEIRVRYRLGITDEILEMIADFQAKSEALKQRLSGV